MCSNFMYLIDFCSVHNITYHKVMKYALPVAMSGLLKEIGAFLRSLSYKRKASLSLSWSLPQNLWSMHNSTSTIEKKSWKKLHRTLSFNVSLIIFEIGVFLFPFFVWTEEVVNVIVQFARFEPQNSFSLIQAWMEHGVIFFFGNQLFRYEFRLFKMIENFWKY